MPMLDTPLTTAPIGPSDLISTRLIYGCMRIADTWEPGEVTPKRRDEARAALRAAVEAGYNHLDNADIYCKGEIETIVGEFLAENPGLREKLIITTKCGVQQPNDPPGAPRRFNLSRDHILASCVGSLKRLGLETLDLYLLHRPDPLIEPEEVAAAFDQLRRQGKVRHFGVSNFPIPRLQNLMRAVDMPLVCNQLQISPERVHLFDDGTLDHLMRLGVQPTAWGPIGGGQFGEGGKVKKDHPHREQMQNAADLLDEMAAKRGVSRTAMTLAWLLRHPAGIMPIVGTRTPERIRDAAKADAIEMSRIDWYRVYEAARGQPA
ncbi:MAG: aldo/keto reductase family oxidoreductase [Phycisphaeraceae bacterium]